MPVSLNTLPLSNKTKHCNLIMCQTILGKY